MSELIVANNGKQIPVGDLAKSFVFVNGQISTITLAYAGTTYKKTFVFDGAGNIQNITQWEAQ